ncbi:hypothetical protein NDU88_008958 [Pleurodeles waltl]|uniref:Uncharacterized protein n=1 Tax=Pleurodeles waltl TaxID=8319 RepID=A0AAV7RVA1_PLEWA|nr:hypothetical protein NDU88_008958 [Pleurodeles waltl]
MEQSTTTALLPQRQTRQVGQREDPDQGAAAGEPSHAELLVDIQGSRVTLAGKIETVALEVNLVLADLWKVLDKGTLDGKEITILNTYTPKMDDKHFFDRIQDLLEDRMGNPVIWVGDYNCILDSDGDRYAPPGKGANFS